MRDRFAGGNRTGGWRLAAGFAGLVLIVCTVTVCLNWRHGNKDYVNNYVAARRLLHGESVYAARRGGTLDFIYPPAAAAMLAPISVAGQFTFTLILIAAATLAWALSVGLSVYLVAGHVWRQHAMLYVIPVVCTVPYVWDIYVMGQPNLLLLALMLAGFACLRVNRQYGAGALIATAAAIKAFPVAALVYLVYRRYWRASASMVIILAGLLLVLPAPFRGFRGSVDDLGAWARGMLHVDANGIGQRASRSFSRNNQSLMSVANRFLRHVNTNASDKDVPMFVNVADLPFAAVNGVVLAAIAGIGLVYVMAMPPARRRTSETDPIEWALLLVLILIFSPYLFGYFNCWLMLPFTVVMSRILGAAPGSRRRVVLVVALAACLALLALALPLPWFGAAQSLGNVFWAHLILISVLTWELWHLGRRTSILSTEVVATSEAALRSRVPLT